MTALGIAIGLATLLFAVLAFLQGRANERRALEARNVVWSRELIDDTWRFRHSGSTTVSEVKIVLTVDGVSEITRADTLAPDTPLQVPSVEHTRLTLQSLEEQLEYERALRSWENLPPSTNRLVPNFAAAGPPPLPPFGLKADISVIITWRYPSGAPDVHELSWEEAY